MEQRAHQQFEKEVATATEGLRHPPTHVRPRLLWSAVPAEAVVEEARREDHQLLVVATRGLGAVARGLLGSVTPGLLHDAACPVLAVPRPRKRRG
jgi:nucleotide-binding universal stress UspA family protein